MIRYLDSEPSLPLRWRDQRAYLLADGARFTPSPSDPNHGTLAVSGYLRGSKALTANHLVHVTGYTEFQLNAIEQRVECAAGARLRGRAGREAKARAAAAADDAEVMV